MGDADSIFEQLYRNRRNGGYGGTLTYPEFCELVHALHWSRETTEDCWADILDCKPVNAVTNMTVVVEKIRQYEQCCTQEGWHGTISMDGRGKMYKPTFNCHDTTSHAVSPSSSPSAPQIAPLPKNSNLASPSIASNGSVQNKSEMLTQGEIGITDKMRSISETVQDDYHTKTQQLFATTEKRRRQSYDLLRPSRYAEQTQSSIRRVSRTSHSGERLTRVERSRRFISSATKTTVSPFQRLYEEAAQRQQVRASREAADRKAALMSTQTASCRADDYSYVDDVKVRRSMLKGQQYALPTQSYRYKLMQSNTTERRDIDTTQATPRVPYYPPPCTPKHIPQGYVEAVTRMRGNTVVAAHRGVKFEQILRKV